MDFTEMTDEQLYELVIAAETELGRRQSLATFDAQIAEVVKAARGNVIPDRGKGEPWEPVTSYEDVYFKGDETTHNGKYWVSNIDNNAGEPGVSGWTEQPTEDEDGNIEYPVITTPAGYEDVKAKGFIGWWPDRDGQLYESLIDSNQWTPETAPQHWKPVDDDAS